VSTIEQVLKQLREQGWTPRVSGGSGRIDEILQHTDPSITEQEVQDFVRIIYEDRRTSKGKVLPLS
jgi:hypothetical protein